MRAHMSSSPSRAQQGVALIIVLIFVVILSGAAAFAARRALFGESVARNMLDNEVARQAAEAALRDAERDVLMAGGGVVAGASCDRASDRPIKQAYGDPNFGTDCPRGQCRFANIAYYTGSNFSTNTNPQPWWPGAGSKWNNTFSGKPPLSTNCNFNGGVALGTFTGTPPLSGVARQPEYLIEYMQRGTDIYFRITARGWGLDPNSEVVMQTFFQRGAV
jgi:type IV pilus assembly protein PilX